MSLEAPQKSAFPVTCPMTAWPTGEVTESVLHEIVLRTTLLS